MNWQYAAPVQSSSILINCDCRHSFTHAEKNLLQYNTQYNSDFSKKYSFFTSLTKHIMAWWVVCRNTIKRQIPQANCNLLKNGLYCRIIKVFCLQSAASFKLKFLFLVLMLSLQNGGVLHRLEVWRSEWGTLLLCLFFWKQWLRKYSTEGFLKIFCMYFNYQHWFIWHPRLDLIHTRPLSHRHSARSHPKLG